MSNNNLRILHGSALYESGPFIVYKAQIDFSQPLAEDFLRATGFREWFYVVHNADTGINEFDTSIFLEARQTAYMWGLQYAKTPGEHWFPLPTAQTYPISDLN